jgi:hypothetical protein
VQVHAFDPLLLNSRVVRLQDWFLALCALHAAMAHLGKCFPQVERLEVQSDGAGCFSTGNFSFSLGAGFSGLPVKGHHFTETGDGKADADRHFRYLKLAIEKHVASGHDVVSPTNVLEALEAHPVAGCTVIGIEIDRAGVKDADHSLPKISVLHSFTFPSQTSAMSFQSFGVGPGQPVDDISK